MGVVVADFERDWIDMLRAALQRDGYHVAPSDTSDQVGIKYFNVRKRRVPRRPRTLHLACDFRCPPDLTAAWKDLGDKIKNGEDLTPHLSRLLGKNFNDRLLNDWGIHHFHLGTTVEDDGFVSRTGPVLFARVSDDDFFAIGVCQHGKWSDRDLLEAIHTNWPNSIERYRLEGFEGIEADVTSADIEKLRAAGVSVHLQMEDGTIYFPVGGGYATDGTSLEAVRTADSYLRKVRLLERYLRENIAAIVAQLQSAGHQLAPPYEFRLDMKDQTFYAVEVRARCAIAFKETV